MSGRVSVHVRGAPGGDVAPDGEEFSSKEAAPDEQSSQSSILQL